MKSQELEKSVLWTHETSGKRGFSVGAVQDMDCILETRPSPPASYSTFKTRYSLFFLFLHLVRVNKICLFNKQYFVYMDIGIVTINGLIAFKSPRRLFSTPARKMSGNGEDSITNQLTAITNDDPLLGQVAMATSGSQKAHAVATCSPFIGMGRAEQCHSAEQKGDFPAKAVHDLQLAPLPIEFKGNVKY